MNFINIVKINYLYDEVFFKTSNGLSLTNTEFNFFKSYVLLFLWSDLLLSEKDKDRNKLDGS